MTLTFNRETYGALLAQYQPKVIITEEISKAQAKTLGQFFNVDFRLFIDQMSAEVLTQSFDQKNKFNLGEASSILAKIAV